MLRCVFLVEVTAWHCRQWQQVTLANMIEPLLGHLEEASYLQPCELACVLFGAHPPYSLAAVESTLQWSSSVAHLRHLLASLEFSGGCGQPVALAEALLEAASLFALPPSSSNGGDGAAQQHCLVCLSSDPSVRPVPWPYPEDCSMAQLPGLATSVELCRALRRRGVGLGMVTCKPATGRAEFVSVQLLWHLANLLSDKPLSLPECRVERLKQFHESLLHQLLQSAATAPGGVTAFLPAWPEALQVVVNVGAKPLSAALLAAKSPQQAATTGAAGTAAAAAAAAPGSGTGEPQGLVNGGGRPPPTEAGGTNGVLAAPAAAMAPPAPAPAPAPTAASPAMQPPPMMQQQQQQQQQPVQAPAQQVPPLQQAAQQHPTPPAWARPTPPPMVQATTPALQMTSPLGAATDASPGSFWDVMTADIAMPDSATADALSAMLSPGVQMPSQQQQQQLHHALQQQYYQQHQQHQQQQGQLGGGGASQQPSVPGLPLPPVQQQQPQPPRQQQHQQQQPRPTQQQLPQPQQQASPHAVPLHQPAQPQMLQPPPQPEPQPQPQQLPAAQPPQPPSAADTATSSGFVLVYSAMVVADHKVAGRSQPMQLGFGQVYGQARDAAMLQSLRWPHELRISKTLAMQQAAGFVASKRNARRTQLKMTQYASQDARDYIEQLVREGSAGIMNLTGGDIGVLLPMRHQPTQRIVLQLAVLPSRA